MDLPGSAVTRTESGMPAFRHAWCTDALGTLHEPTWDVKNATGLEMYFGLTFTLSQISALQVRCGTYDWYVDLRNILKATEHWVADDVAHLCGQELASLLLTKFRRRAVA